MQNEPARSPWWSLLPLCAAVALYKLDSTIVNVALPTIQKDLNTTPATLLWTVDSYLLALAAAIPLAGVLGDRLGRRRVFMIGIAVFTLASAACALAPSDEVLIACRTVQGLAAGVLVPLSMGIIGATFRDEHLPTAYGYWSGFSSIGIVIGPIAGGVLVQHFGWSSIFWVNVPLGLLLLPLVHVLVPETRDTSPRRLDVGGAILSTLGILLISWGLIGSTTGISATECVITALGVISLGGFVLWERRTPEPMLPLSFFREPGFTLGAVIGMIVYAYPAIMVFLTLYLQGILGKPPQTAGLLFIPLAATLTVVAVFAGPITKRFGALPSMATGMVLMSLGAVVFAALPVGGSLTRLIAGEVILAAGIMLAIPAAGAVMMASVPRERAGVGAAAMQAFRQIGAVFGVAMFGAIAAAQTKATYSAPSSAADTPQVIQDVVGGEISHIADTAGAQAADLGAAAWLDGMHLAMLVVAAFALLGAALCLVALRRRQRADDTHPAVHH